MIKKYVLGIPFETEAVTKDISPSTDFPSVFHISTESGFSLSYSMKDSDVIYGLGEANRGINKRGYKYINYNSDNSQHYEDATSLYGAHNFIIVDGSEHFGLFFDYPGELVFDIGYSRYSCLNVSCEDANMYLYYITGDNSYDIVRQFRKLIGRSYIPPKFAFGYGQSRWGYKTADDFNKVADMHRDNNIPIDMIYMDIDYMEDYKDFTYNNENFPDFKAFVDSMKAKHIHLIPIIDAGVKIEKGYDVYEEGIRNGYFCKRANGEYFEAVVWPGYTHFPDVLNKDARQWFGNKYKKLIDDGIDGFWNDMNEPAIFHTHEGIARAKEKSREFAQDDGNIQGDVWQLFGDLLSISNSRTDYKSFYHNIDGEMILHDRVHNLFGYNMTRAAGEAFDRICPDRRILMFSRSSYIGMHRYGGLWTGDNYSWWSHLLLNIKMMPSLNMCGFLYSGADIGGFASNTTEDLVLRWLAFGVFTPLMRNHSAEGTREQEFYQFECTDKYRNLVNVRYRLIPYIYSEYMKAALNDDMYIKPLSFEYPEDEYAKSIEDQLMIGNEIMIAPVYTQNVTGRLVYLPEDMMLLKFLGDGRIYTEQMTKGAHFVEIALDEVVLFIRPCKIIPIAKVGQYIEEVNVSPLITYGYDGCTYELYNDDGVSKDYDNPNNITILTK